METDLGEPAGAGALSLPLGFLPGYSPDCRGRRRGAEAGAEKGVTALGRVGWLQEWGNGRRRDLWQREASSWLLPASQREVAGGGLPGGAGRQSTQAETSRAALHTRRKELPKSAPACSRQPACGTGRAGPAELTQGPLAALGGYPQGAGLGPALGWRLRGLFFPEAGGVPPGPSLGRRIHCLPENRGAVI